MDASLAREWVTAVARTIAAEADELTRLDTEIGDGDHGTNMARGFSAVLTALDGSDGGAVGEVFTRTGATLISRVGGASGPLFGAAFRAVGRALPGSSASPVEVAGALRAGLEALRTLGGAAPGDKTIVDAYAPAVEAFTEVAEGGADLPLAATAAATAAEQGMRSTVDLQARKGRASYLGPRSVGHQDPGATSTWLIFRCLAEVAAPRG
jgi:dihydroxyacetone kinase-like protein